MATNFINERLSMSDVMAITPQEEAVCKAFGIPTLKGKLFVQDDFGNLIFKRSNTVVLGGAILTLEKLTGTNASYAPSSLNIQENNSMVCKKPSTRTGEYDEEYERTLESTNPSRIMMFGVGSGGAGDTFGDVYTPSFLQDSLNNWLPFRVCPNNSLDYAGYLPGDNNKAERDKYHFLVKDDTIPTMPYRWYLKQFETPASVKSLWKNTGSLTKDGTEIVSAPDVTNGPQGVGIETLAEFTMTITRDDIYPYFSASSNMVNARYNTLGLFTGTLMDTTEVSGYQEAYNVRLFSVVNFENESLKNAKDTTYVYRIYSSL